VSAIVATRGRFVVASAFRQLIRQPTMATIVLAAVIASVGGVLSALAPAGALLTRPAGYGATFLLLAVSVAFLLTELGQALIEFRNQAYSFSLSGIPMLLGLLYCPPQQLIACRVLSAVVAFRIQKAPPLKLAFNTASYLLDTALVLDMAHALVGGHPALTLRTAFMCYVSLATVDLVMSALVLLVIRINEGTLNASDVIEVLVPAAGFVALNTCLGFICAVQLGAGSLGPVLLVSLATVIAVTYRGYLVLRRRHQSLQVVQTFIEQTEGAQTAEELAEHMLTEIRTLMRARVVEFTFHDDHANVTVQLSTGDGEDPPATTFQRLTLGDPLYADGLKPRAALILPKTTDPGERRWLRTHGLRDAVVVPLARDGVRGMLVAVDRLGDSATFTVDDLALMQALAGHLAVAMRNTQLVAALRHDANHDALTGLGNRALLTARLQDALSKSSVDTQPAVLLLDLDRFKEVNDTLGHHVGDELLRVVAARLREFDRAGTTIARLGGDEFAVLLPTAGMEDAAVALAERIAARLRVAVELSDVTVSTAASIGVAFGRPGHDQADVLMHADTAMYAAKSSGASVRVYTANLDAGRADRLVLLNDLHRALEDNALDVHYQPKLDLGFDLITGVEALVRWDHPTRGLIPPDIFIPLAESTGLIEPLTRAVLATALRQCRDWQDEGLDLTVAVNLSVRNLLNAALPDQIAAALVTAGLPAQKLILEITESSVMVDPERTIAVLERLASIGVTLSLDDFGTGYSSLSYLQQLPVKEVKIDRSFVLGLSRVPEQRASDLLVRSIISLSTSLGMRVVAEGVEDLATLEHLRDLGCDVIQGYYIGRPLTAAQIVALVSSTSTRVSLSSPIMSH
jgi:diguanylate cyclase (GGDEF)-like protein